MEVNDHGYRFFTIHNEFGNTAQVNGRFERFQTQAPILPRQPFALDFYGRGSSIELLVTTLPRRATPQQRASLQRQKLDTGASSGLPPLSGAATLSNSVSVTHRADAPRSAEAIRAAALARARSAAPSAGSSEPPSPDAPGVVAFRVGPEFNSPFDIDFLDGWGLDQPPFPPDFPPGGGGGGGGGGGLFHSAVRLELFVLGSDQPIETWELPEGIDSRFRSVKYEPQGFPSPDAPVRKTTWFRVVATPLGFDPVEIFVGANTRIADVPIRTTSLGVRLTNHLFRVGLEALMLDVSVSGGTARLALGRELTELLGVEQVFEEKSISPATSSAKLRSLKITSIGGREFHALARRKYGERADRVTLPNQNLTREEKMAVLFQSQLAKLAEVKNEDICIRIEAAFSKAAVAVWGFDIASLNGELGETVITFDRRMNRLRAFSFLDVDFSTIGSIAKAVVDLFTSVPTNVNKIVEDAIETNQQEMLKYLKAFLARAVGASNVVQEAWFQDNAWKIRNSADPVIPKPGQVVRPPLDGSILEGGILEILSLANALGEIEPADVPEAPTPEASPPTPLPEPEGSLARALPPEFLLTSDEQLARLDRHQSIVVVMMENRSYDHMLGDLMHMRPDPEDPYDGAPFGVKTAGVHGFINGVPLVRARDLRLGTAIPVSPGHSFRATTYQIGDGTEQGRGTGEMLGFARDLYRRSDSPQQAMTVYSEADLPTYYKLADEFCTCERWFAAHPGPTWPNRFATLMGSIPELENFHMDDPRIGYLKDRNIFDALNGARVDWRLFESDLSIIRMFDRFRLDSTNVVPIDDAEVGLEATLRKPGPLPRVMFIEPNFADIPPVKTADDDHPPADIAHGQKFISRICDLIWDSGRFGQVLLVITYDEHGGFYDHVPPPGTERGEQRSIARLHPDGPAFLGVRVPAFVVSPFVSARAKSRTVFDHTSILKTILVHNRDRFSNDVLTGFGPRVNEAADLSAVLDLPDPRPSPQPFIRRRTGTVPPRFGDHVDLGTLLEISASASTLPSFTPLSGVTPRELSISERTVPPGAHFEPDDFHGALYKLMRPRKL